MNIWWALWIRLSRLSIEINSDAKGNKLSVNRFRMNTLTFDGWMANGSHFKCQWMAKTVACRYRMPSSRWTSLQTFTEKKRTKKVRNLLNAVDFARHHYAIHNFRLHSVRWANSTFLADNPTLLSASSFALNITIWSRALKSFWIESK